MERRAVMILRCGVGGISSFASSVIKLVAS
jgi:hypothetical protein